MLSFVGLHFIHNTLTVKYPDGYWTFQIAFPIYINTSMTYLHFPLVLALNM